jgi:DNA-binding response OmpR family regulator
MPESGKQTDRNAAARVLIITETAKAVFQSQLEAAGYETLTESTVMTRRAITEFKPDVLIFEVAGTESIADARMALVRQLRANAVTYLLPVVMVSDSNTETFRKAAANVGVDDCFERATPFPEVLARLDSLFWRIEAGRLAPGLIGNQRLEIDSFLLLLDGIRDDITAQRQGSLALLKIDSPSPNSRAVGSFDQGRRGALGFFKLHLRRLDAVAYYGPDALVFWIPGMSLLAASSRLKELRDTFAQEHPGTAMRMGLASYPADGTDLEKLLERCAAAANNASDIEFTDKAAELKKPEVKIATREDYGMPGSQSAQTTSLPEIPAELTKTEARLGGRAEEHEPNQAPRVLLAVSDAPRMARLNSLMRAAGYEVRAAFDGEQTLSLLRIERPHLLMLESGLAKVNGLEMIGRLRKQGGGQLSVPVLFLDSSGDDATGRQALALGARKVLTQPYDPADVLAGVEAVVNNC